MSRIGKMPVTIPSGVEVKIDGNNVTVKGKLGELNYQFNPGMAVEVKDNQVVITRDSDLKTVRAMHGLTRALINNLVVGVSEGFSKTLEIIGIGYNAKVVKNAIILNLGYSHPIYFALPQGITVEVPEPTKVVVKGIDKHLVGEVASNIRKQRPPEPYKGKGIRYENEQVRRKAGKTAGA